MHTTNEITLYDLMSEDISVWLKNNGKKGFALYLGDEKDATLVDEEGIHPYAIESFANLCRRFVKCYDRAIKDDVA